MDIETIIYFIIVIVAFALTILGAWCDAKYNEQHYVEKLLLERW